MAELYVHIAATIRELRQLRGLSQEGLADLVGVPANTVSRWETGTYKPSAEDLDQLARAFEVSITVFFPESQKEEGRSAAAQALLSATRNLNKDDLDEVTRYAEFRRARRLLEKEKQRPKKRRSS